MLREIKTEDLDKICQLEKSAFPIGAWNKQMLYSSIKTDNCYKICYEEAGEIVGYTLASFSLFDTEILTIAVNKNHCRRGIAKSMLNYIKAQCKKNGQEKIFLEVRKSNIPAINLYLGFGFKQIAIRKKYYENTEDAIIMEFKVSGS